MGLDRNRLPEPLAYFQETEGLKLTGRGKWRTARCDFHGGSDSMRVNLETGAFVCMAQCGARGGDVLAYQMAAHGQDFITAAKTLGCWQDDPHDQHRIRHRPLPFPARDALEVLRGEALLCAVAACNVAKGTPLSDADRHRLVQAAGRIERIASEVTL